MRGARPQATRAPAGLGRGRAALLPLLLLLLLCALVACTRDDPGQGAERDPAAEPPPDPYAHCRSFLEGTWTRGSNFELRYEAASGGAIINWRGNHTVVASAFLECHPDRARLTAEGKIIELRFLDADTIEASNPAYGSAIVHRSPAAE